MRLAFVGPSGAGKDEAGEFVSRCFAGLPYWGPTSLVIAPHIAAEDGVSIEEAYAHRHRDKERWRKKGDLLRLHDPAHLARKTLETGRIVVGVRSLIEITAVRAEGLVDLIVWIDRDVPPDPTLEYGSELADLVIENHWGLPEFHDRLRRLGRALGLREIANTAKEKNHA